MQEWLIPLVINKRYLVLSQCRSIAASKIIGMSTDRADFAEFIDMHSLPGHRNKFIGVEYAIIIPEFNCPVRERSRYSELCKCNHLLNMFIVQWNYVCVVLFKRHFVYMQHLHPGDIHELLPFSWLFNPLRRCI